VIRLVATRVEDDGSETDLGEVRLTEVGAVYSHSATAEGLAIVADVVGRLGNLAAEVQTRGTIRAHDASPYDLGALGRERAARRGW
jgi:hypothetical protein